MTDPHASTLQSEQAEAGSGADFRQAAGSIGEPVSPIEFAQALPEEIRDAGEAIHHAAELAAHEAQAGFERVRAAGEEAASGVEAVLQAASAGVTELNLKALEAVRSSTHSAFEFMRALAGARTLSQVVELQTELVRKQFEAGNAQAREFTELAARVSSSVVAPLGKAMGQSVAEPGASARQPS
ncbi:MAG: TIGR01841 family phasin [Beijerinckiaceae bacterium]|nr:TIGR01841 family phasin [Beijerinckiaceae bacterium]